MTFLIFLLYFPHALDRSLAKFSNWCRSWPINISARYWHSTIQWCECTVKQNLIFWEEKELKFNYSPPCFCYRSDCPTVTGTAPLIYRSRHKISLESYTKYTAKQNINLSAKATVNFNWDTPWENLLCHMRTTKAQISQRWPALLLFAA